MKPGDIIGFSGRHWLSACIATGSIALPWHGLSHVGIVGEHNNELALFESTTLEDQPCLIQGTTFKGSQCHRLDSITRYPGKVWHYSLYRDLYPDEAERLNDFLHETVGTPYDRIGAFRSGGIGFSAIEGVLREENLSRLFCSEWVAKAHSTIGIFATANASRWNPSKLIRAERFAGILHKPTHINEETVPDLFVARRLHASRIPDSQRSAVAAASELDFTMG